MLTYRLEDFRRMTGELGLWAGQPRGWHHSMIVRRYDGDKTLLIADRRECDYLTFPHREFKEGNMEELVANRGQSCTEACLTKRMRCSGPQLPYVNTCEAMQRNFKCEGGCGNDAG